MISKFEITAVHFSLDDKLRKYATNKIAKLDKYISRHARASAHAEVRLKEQKAKDKKRCICEVVLHLPKDTITIEEATVNMYAAIDIVEEKLKNQLKRYKETHSNPRLHQKVLRKLKIMQ